MYLSKLVRIGNSTGLVIPKDCLRKMQLRAGGYLYLIDTQDGYYLAPYNHTLEAQLGLADYVAREARVILRALED
jgi:bifunctional DNA-binding transcriptional regulator/antitoxin component of YhaV-PrlF toxin-antitoxin module